MKLSLNVIPLALILFTTSYSYETLRKASAEQLLLLMKTNQMTKPIYQQKEIMIVDVSKVTEEL